MITVFPGPDPFRWIEGHPFQKNVPMFVPQNLRQQIEFDGYFEDYEPANLENYSSCNIQVTLPIDVRYICASLWSLQRISELYPTANIEVIISPIFSPLFKDIPVNIVGSTSTAPGYYAANYDFTVNLNYFFSAIAIERIPMETIYLRRFNLSFELLQEKELKRREKEIEEGKTVNIDPMNYYIKKSRTPFRFVDTAKDGPILILGQGKSPKSTFKNLGNYLNKNIKDSQIISKNTNFRDMYKEIKNAKMVISCGESQWSQLAAYLDKPLFVFLSPDRPDFKKQYSIFNNVIIRRIGDDDSTNIVSDIKEYIETKLPELEKKSPEIKIESKPKSAPIEIKEEIPKLKTIPENLDYSEYITIINSLKKKDKTDFYSYYFVDDNSKTISLNDDIDKEKAIEILSPILYKMGFFN